MNCRGRNGPLRVEENAAVTVEDAERSAGAAMEWPAALTQTILPSVGSADQISSSGEPRLSHYGRQGPPGTSASPPSPPAPPHRASVSGDWHQGGVRQEQRDARAWPQSLRTVRDPMRGRGLDAGKLGTPPIPRRRAARGCGAGRSVREPPSGASSPRALRGPTHPGPDGEYEKETHPPPPPHHPNKKQKNTPKNNTQNSRPDGSMGSPSRRARASTSVVTIGPNFAMSDPLARPTVRGTIPEMSATYRSSGAGREDERFRSSARPPSKVAAARG